MVFRLLLHWNVMKKLFYALLTVGLAASARADYQPAFQQGENLTFAVRWGIITGGYATLGVPSIDLIGHEPTYHILSEARSAGVIDAFYKVRDRNEAWMDKARPRSLRYSK